MVWTGHVPWSLLARALHQGIRTGTKLLLTMRHMHRQHQCAAPRQCARATRICQKAKAVHPTSKAFLAPHKLPCTYHCKPWLGTVHVVAVLA
eukprot:1139851-Pelagomonas_calceolata.AAC.2